MISLALNDSILLKAVLALAAQHKANTSHSFYQSPRLTDTHQHALVFKHQAIHGLSQAVTDVGLCRDTTVASIFLLVFLDLLESGSDRWNVHLEGAKSLLAFNSPLNDNPGQTVQEIRNFIAKQIYLYVSSRLLLSTADRRTGLKPLEAHLYVPSCFLSSLPQTCSKIPWNSPFWGVQSTFLTPSNTFPTKETP